MILSARPLLNLLKSLVVATVLSVVVLGAFTTVILATTHSAYAATTGSAENPETLGQMSDHLFNSILSIQTFLSTLSYILGVFFSITGLQMLRANVDDPGRNPAMPALLRLGAAAFFIFSPTFANLIISSIGGGSGNVVTMTNADGFTPNPDSKTGGLDGALVRFVYDFAEPFLQNLLPFFAYLGGLIFMLIGLKRLALANGDGPQAPGGMGTIGTFIVAAALMAFGYIMFILQGSLFGKTEMFSNPLFVTDSSSTDLKGRAEQVMWGVFIFLRVVGYISVLRGLFMLRAIGEGQNIPMMSVGTHLIAGALLANGTAFVLMAQETFVANPADYVLK